MSKACLIFCLHFTWWSKMILYFRHLLVSWIVLYVFYCVRLDHATNLGNVEVQLLYGSIRNASTIADNGYPIAIHGSQLIQAFPTCWQWQSLFLLPLVPCLVQERTFMGWYLDHVGSLVERLSYWQVYVFCCIGHPGSTSRLHYWLSSIIWRDYQGKDKK